MGRRLFWASAGLTALVFLGRYVLDASGPVLFVLAALALVPLALAIGEATEHVAEHTGHGVGGFLNASFGNAPELIIALFAIQDQLPDVVRGAITGSVVSTLLLVLGVAMVLKREGRIDRHSLLLQVSMIGFALALFLIPSVPGWHGVAERHELYLLTLPVAGVLLVVYLVLTVRNLHMHRVAHVAEASEQAWPLRTGMLVLALATVGTALVSEVLVHSLAAFGESIGLSQFFVATVIVATVGNAAEHGGAIVVAHRGNAQLAAEIAVSSATQIAVFVAPVIALLSVFMGHGLPLSFRPVELATMAVAALVVAFAVLDGRVRRWEGFMMLSFYAAAVAAFALSGDR